MKTVLLALTFVSSLSAHAMNLRVSFQTVSGKRINITGNPNEVMARGTTNDDTTHFVLIDSNGGLLEMGDAVFIKTSRGTYFTAENSGGEDLVVNRTMAQAWERFTIHRTNNRPDDRKIVTGDTVAFRNNTGKYWITAVNGGGEKVRVTSTNPTDPATQFKMAEMGRPPQQKLSAPMQSPGAFGMPTGVDYDSVDRNFAGNCSDYRGRAFPGCYDGHTGIDFGLFGGEASAKAGFDVIAAAAGQVVHIADGNPDRCHADPTASGGIRCPNTDKVRANYVLVRQDDGLYAYYFHLKKWSIAVTRGQRVECGMLIGEVGSSGKSTGPHLHFEMRTAMTGEEENAARAGNEDLTDLTSKEVTENTQFFDPYREVRWMQLVREIPKRVCNPGNPGSCFEEKTKLECENSAQWAACSILTGPLSGACMQWGGFPPRCRRTCEDVCRRVTVRTPKACSN